MRLLLACVLCLLSLAAPAQSLRGGAPDWLFPRIPPIPANAPPADNVKKIQVPNSEASFTAAQLADLFSVPDWHPAGHGPMPDVVAHGRPPNVFACGHCHMPRGQGRPENAALAGLPAQYIIQQVVDMKNGVRRNALRGSYVPDDRMNQVAKNVTDADLAAAADYFASQRMTKRTRVIETPRVPKMKPFGWIYAPLPGGKTEPLGKRLLEATLDPELHEQRADGEIYLAYAPPGSLKRGKALAASTCAACHGERLQGVGLVPPLAGRSPSYILRQLLAFKSGTRAGKTGEPMKAIVAPLQLDSMIDVAAYAGWLNP